MPGKVGSKPNTGQPIRHRVAPRLDWIEVENVPHEGGPELPRDTTWPAATLAWWDTIRAMPHASLWDEADWAFALDTALVHAKLWGGNVQAATELRNREKVLGTTWDFRRDLRIKYVEPAQDERAGPTALEDYRKRLGG